MPITALAFLKTTAGKSVVGVVAVAALAGYAYLAGRSSGVDSCEERHELARLKAVEEAQQHYNAALAWGNQISTQLAQTQRRLNETKSEYLAYANGIVGNCDGSIGLFLAAESAPGSLPEAPGAPTDAAPAVEAPPIAASLVAANIAENRWRFEANYAQCTALIAWHTENPVK